MRISDWSSDVCSSDLFLNESILVMVILRGAGGWGSGDGRGKIGEQVGRPVEAGTGQEAGRELLRAMFAKKTVDPLLPVGRGRNAKLTSNRAEGCRQCVS